MYISNDEAIKLVKAAEKMTPSEIQALQRERLKKLVDFARKNSQFYNELYRDISDNFSITDLPHTEKKIIMQDYERWWTESDFHKSDVLHYISQDPNTRGNFLGKYTVLTTSGTTGEPLLMIRDAHRNAIHGAILSSRFFEAIGDLLDFSKHKNAALVLDDPKVSSYSSFLRRKASRPGFENNMLCVPVRLGTDEKVKMLNDFQPELITGYPSEAFLMALQQKKGKLNISPKAIVCSAEMLTPEIYRTLKETFNCAILNNYCMTEGGEVACMSKCPHLHVNSDWIIVEPVDENKNVITDSNTWSHGIFVTDLSNFIQPVIRYYIEDSVRILPSECELSPFPEIVIRGRVSPVRKICGQDVPQSALEHIMEVKEGVILFQFIQTSADSLEIRGILSDNADTSSLKAEILSETQKQLNECGCKNYNLSWSDEPLIRNAKGGKLSLYVVM